MKKFIALIIINLFFINSALAATLVSDNFDRADSDTFGTDWTEQKGDWDIVSNKGSHVTDSGTGGEDVAIFNTALGANPDADYEVEAIVRLTSTGGLGVYARWTDDSNHYFNYLNTVSQNFQMYKKVSGTYTQLGSTYSAGQSTDTDYTIKLSAIGSALKSYQDGVERISATDTAITATGKPALLSDSSGKLYNDFFVYGTADSVAPATTNSPTVNIQGQVNVQGGQMIIK